MHFSDVTSKTDQQPIPFIPYPTNPTTGSPAETRLRPLGTDENLEYGSPMTDPITGIHVPILAVTVHPQTHQILPVGGSQIDPITGLPVAIEIGAVMIDVESRTTVPILAVTIDNMTGKYFTSFQNKTSTSIAQLFFNLQCV